MKVSEFFFASMLETAIEKYWLFCGFGARTSCKCKRNQHFYGLFYSERKWNT